MPSAPPSGPVMLAGPSNPAGLGPMVQAYWNTMNNLLQTIPDVQIRSSVRRLIDERVHEQVNMNVPLLQGVPLTFATLQQTQAAFQLINQFIPLWTTTFLQQAIIHVTAFYVAYMQTPETMALLERWNASDSIVAVVLTAAAPWLALQGLAVAGFTASGVMAGTAAALWQSSIGNVVAGSLFSSFQSMGAVGALTGPWGIAACATSAAGFGVYKWATMPSKAERFKSKLDELLGNTTKRNQFWASIGV